MRNVIVTGGAGMIGSNLVKALVKLGDNVLVIDNLSRGKLEYLYENGEPCINFKTNLFIRDLREPTAMDDLLINVDYVVHLADVVAGIGYVFTHQLDIFRTNILINSNVFNSVRNSEVRGILYVGTACSFPQNLQNSVDALPLKENQLYPADPESAYGWSKLMGQYEMELLQAEGKHLACTLMLHNVYGIPCDFSKEKSQVIPALIRKVVTGNYLEVWGSGKQGRAFVHVDDVVNAIVLALNVGWNKGPIQIGPDVCTSIKEIAESLVEISERDLVIRFDHSKPEGDKGRSADYSKAYEVLGWAPKVLLADGLKEMYYWIKEKLQVNS